MPIEVSKLGQVENRITCKNVFEQDNSFVLNMIPEQLFDAPFALIEI